MLRKLIIFGLVIVCFITFPLSSVIAADEEHTFNDGTGDVIDEELEKHPEIQDIDITNIVYSKTGKTLTLEINLVDKIKKLSDITLAIIVALYTSEQEYEILYLYEPPADTVFAYAGDNEISVDVDGFNTNKLTLTFDLINATEIYDEIIVSLSKSDSQGSYLYSDLYPNEEIVFLDVDAGEDRTVKVNQSVQFTGTASGGTAPYTWEWYFDGDEIIDSTNQNPTFKFTEPGTYDVELNVYDSGEGVGIAYVTVTVTGTNGGNGNGNNGLPSTDSGSGLIIFIILIVIIIVVAVAVVVYVIKK